jgi:hypothetical protein
MLMLGDYLQAQLSRIWQTPTPLAPGSVVVTGYQFLAVDRALVMDGFVDNGQSQFPFRAVLDLHFSKRTMIYLASGPTPTADDLAQVAQMNQLIYGLTIGPGQ